jgi:hypothetical protein
MVELGYRRRAASMSVTRDRTPRPPNTDDSSPEDGPKEGKAKIMPMPRKDDLAKDELIQALAELGEDILEESVPKHLTDILRRRERQ